MPSEFGLTQAHRTVVASQRHSLSVDRTANNELQSSSNPHGNSKVKKHMVHAGRVHTRIPSSKGIHKTHTDTNAEMGPRKPSGNVSTTSLKKNNSHVNLKRNRSSAEVKPKFAVTFEIGEQEDGWEETSSSASPVASHSHSRTDLVSQSPTPAPLPLTHPKSPGEMIKNTPSVRQTSRSSTADTKALTDRLLSRTQSRHTTQMSLATANPSIAEDHSLPSSPPSSSVHACQIGSSITGQTKRYIAGSSSPTETPKFLTRYHCEPLEVSNNVKHIKSMKNLSNGELEGNETSAITPHARPSGAGQSRTQQKLWLQRASSHIESSQSSSFPGRASGLVDATDGSRDPRIKNQLARTGVEYIVVQRYQDPVGNALKRVARIPGMEPLTRLQQNIKRYAEGSGSAHAMGHSLLGTTQGKKVNLSKSISRQQKIVSNYSDNFNKVEGKNDPNVIPTDKKRISNSTTIESENITILLRKLWEKSSDSSTCANTNS
ncbi:Bgt-695 [Blumeria graminis f. sp. tritici]|uniref:Bgt-695 n=1 Tax=Blumeria graminis f. sp. tritici TaxID=62690 RepID=A0A9X9MKD4_BLUGR|nr:Bgt-695 [Blumeria graminis f. sp. tritici]